MTAYLVRQSGAKRELASWTVALEQGEYYEIAGVLASGVTFIRHAKGGLDQLPEVELATYDAPADAFGPVRYIGAEIAVDVAADRASATVTTCTLPSGGTYDPRLACAQQAGATVTRHPIP